MFGKIVAAIDADTDRADAVLKAAETLGSGLQAQVLVAHVREVERPAAMVAATARPGALPPLVQTETIPAAHDMVTDAVDRLRRMGVRAEGHAPSGRGSSARQLIGLAEEFGADLIIVGDRESPLSDVVLGGVGHRIVRLADCSVLLVR